MKALKNARSGGGEGVGTPITRIKKGGVGGTSTNSSTTTTTTTTTTTNTEKNGRIETIKKLSTKSNKKRIFGERCFDYISSCRHQFTRRTPPINHNNNNNPNNIIIDPNYVFCPYCRLINTSLKKFFLIESNEKAIARAESLKNRSILRTKLLYQWSQSQSFHYQFHEIDTCIDIIWSISLADSIISNDSLLTLIQRKSKKSNFWFQSSSSSSSSLLLPHLKTNTLDEQLPVIDFDEMIKILQRNKRMNEVGHLSAMILQSYIRRYLTKVKIRRMVLKRFELVPATKTQSAYYYDTKKRRRWNNVPYLIAKERPATPRTIDRRLNHEKKIIQKKCENYENFLKLEKMQYEQNPFHSYHFIEKDIRIIRYLKQLVIVRDLLLVVMNQLNEIERLKVDKKHEEERIAAANDLLSQLSSKTAKQTNQKEAAAAAVPIETVFKPVWIVPTAPGLPSRQFGLSIALLTTPSPSNHASTPNAGLRKSAAITAPSTPSIRTPSSYNFTPVARTPSMIENPTPVSRTSSMIGKQPTAGGGGSVATISPVQRALQILEQSVWESLICHTAEEIVQKLLIKDLIPVYESVINFSHDEFGIWNPAYKKNTLAEPSFSTNSAGQSNSESNVEGKSATKSESQAIPLEGQEEKLKSEEAVSPPIESKRPEVLPFGFQLRIARQDSEISANGFFRLFFFEEELVGLSACSPWVFYPEVYRNKEGILSSITKFVTQTTIKAMIHSIYRTANKTHPKYQQIAAHGGYDNTKRKMSVLPQSIGNRKKSVSGNTTNINNLSSSKLEKYLSLFLPSESMIFGGSNDATSAEGSAFSNVDNNLGRPTILTGMDKKSIYNEAIILDLNSLTDDQVLYIHEQYKFTKKLKPFQEKLKRVLQNQMRRKEKEKKEREEKKMQEALILEDLEEEIQKKEPTSSQITTTAAAEISERKNSNPPPNANGSSHRNSKSGIHSVLDRIDWKKAFGEIEVEVKGTEIFETYADPTGSLRKEEERRQKEAAELEKKANDVENNSVQDGMKKEESKEWNDYIKRLFETSVNVNTNMSHRIHPPAGLIDNYPIAQLLVMDVYLTLPKPNKNDLTGNPSLTRRTSVSSLGAASLSFPVEIHQIVGIFPCEMEKCPANLDCGLFEYEYFHNLFNQQQQQQQQERKNSSHHKEKDDDNHSVNSSTSSKSTRPPPSNTGDGGEVNNYFLRERDWLPPNQNTGITIGKSNLTSGFEFQYHLLGSWPSKEYLDQALPKKIKIWLGLPI